MARGSPVPLIIQREILAAFLSGVPSQAIARQFKYHPSTISKILRTVKQSAAKESISELRSQIRDRSYQTLNLALAPTQSQEKALRAGPLAVQCLKGLGEFESEQRGNTIQIAIAIPSGMTKPELIGNQQDAIADASAQTLDTKQLAE